MSDDPRTVAHHPPDALSADGRSLCDWCDEPATDTTGTKCDRHAFPDQRGDR